jgi:hypothetical protein
MARSASTSSWMNANAPSRVERVAEEGSSERRYSAPSKLRLELRDSSLAEAADLYLHSIASEPKRGHSISNEPKRGHSISNPEPIVQSPLLDPLMEAADMYMRSLSPKPDFPAAAPEVDSAKSAGPVEIHHHHHHYHYPASEVKTETEVDSDGQGVLEALGHLRSVYEIRVCPANSLAEPVRLAFSAESCPVCLTADDKGAVVTFRCKRLGCMHAAHAVCVLGRPQCIQRTHPSTSFKAVQRSANTDMDGMVMGGRNNCLITLSICHILSDVCIARLELGGPQMPLDSVYNPHSELEFLFVPQLISGNFSVKRGRMFFELSSPNTGEVLKFQSNFDIATLPNPQSSSDSDLVLVDTGTGASLTVTVLLNLDLTWAVSRLSVELPPVPPLMTAGPQTLSLPQPQPYQHYKSKKLAASSKEYSPLGSKGKDASKRVYEEHMSLMAKSQSGSRFLQQKLQEGDAEYYALVFAEVYESLPSLMVRVYAYLLLMGVFCAPHIAPHMPQFSSFLIARLCLSDKFAKYVYLV